MSESKASRTLLKSSPELWSEVSNAASLRRHLGQFGDIRITELESESAVAWEGEHARGTIRLEPSGWGTRVSLTAQPVRVGPNGPVAEEERAEARPVAEQEGAAVDSAEVQMRGEIDRDQGASGQRADGADGPRLPPPRAPDPLHTVQADVHEPTAFSEHNPGETEQRERRWSKRLADRVRRWFSPQPQDDRELVEAQPIPGAPAVEPAPAADTPPSAQAHTESPDGEGPPATTVALNAALDSLGRAHHRPFSRA